MIGLPANPRVGGYSPGNVSVPWGQAGLDYPNLALTYWRTVNG
ncbi:MAG: hypothetical protein ACKO21_00145 [Nodosilinea sp.]